MKKITILLFTFLLSASVFAGIKIDPTALPKTALKFIKDNFSTEEILYAEQDFNEFEVYLSNGVEIQFGRTGEWEEIDGNYSLLPENVIPANILKAIKARYPDAGVIKIEKEFSGYDVRLNNHMEIYIDNAGTILRGKYND